jgi:hypothetical protein
VLERSVVLQQGSSDSSQTGFQRYFFNSRAVGLRAKIYKPYFEDLGEHAVVSTYGGSTGHSTSRNEGFAINKDVSYGAAYSELIARSEGYIWRSIIQATVERLNILDRITADAVVCRLEGVYDSRSYPGPKTTLILPTGSKIVNLRVDGQLIEPRLPPAFGLNDWQAKEFFAGKHDPKDPQFYPGIYPEPFYKEGLGTLHFAEWSWVHPGGHDEQKISMIRFALGSYFGMDGECAAGSTNGRGWP